MSDGPVAPLFDAAALIAKVRAGDPAALAEAYRVTFNGDLGRLVLAHYLAQCGVGSQLGREDLEYRAGRHDAAIALASMAGFDAPAIAVGVLTDELQGETHDDDGSRRGRHDDGASLDDWG